MVDSDQSGILVGADAGDRYVLRRGWRHRPVPMGKCVDNRRQHRRLRQHLGTKCVARNISNVSRSETLPQTLVRSKEKCAVFDDGSSRAASVLIEPQRGKSRSVKWPAGIQNVIAEEFKNSAVELICSGFGN